MPGAFQAKSIKSRPQSSDNAHQAHKAVSWLPLVETPGSEVAPLVETPGSEVSPPGEDTRQ